MRSLALAVVLMPAFALAQQVPGAIAYQGRLLDAAGAPVAGITTLTFTLYDAPTAGSSLWTDTQSIALTNGYYATELAIPATLFDGTDSYLEVTAGTPLTPRQHVG